MDTYLITITNQDGSLYFCATRFNHQTSHQSQLASLLHQYGWEYQKDQARRDSINCHSTW